jgi:hypothetical protein
MSIAAVDVELNAHRLVARQLVVVGFAARWLSARYQILAPAASRQPSSAMQWSSS